MTRRAGERVVRARSSAEEHYLDMVGVTGSIPVAPTNKHREKSGVSAENLSEGKPALAMSRREATNGCPKAERPDFGRKCEGQDVTQKFDCQTRPRRA